MKNKKRLTIYMGSACNMDCKYCHREPDVLEGFRGISPKVLDAVRGRDDLIIKFMGGEPTLYMDDIKKVVEAAPDCEFAIATNGIDLDKYLPYFQEHNFLVVLSYDGGAADLRGYDPLTKVIDYPFISISTTLYHGNTDFETIFRNFAAKERIVGRTLTFFPHIMHVTNPENEQYALTLEDYESIIKQMEAYTTKALDIWERYGVRDRRYEGILNFFTRREEMAFEQGETYCSNKDLIKIDTAGRRHPCQYIRDMTLGENWLEEQKDLLMPKCRNCPVYDMCGGACYVSTERILECYFYRTLFQWWKGGPSERYRNLSEPDPDERAGEAEH